jgi:hypothetical protein
MITSRHDTNRAKQVHAAIDAIFTVLMDVEISVALDALEHVSKEFQRAQQEPDVVLSAEAIKP